jgi:osmoprotectant transport system permease protein
MIGCDAKNTRVGSKLDAESALLGTMASLLIESTGKSVTFREGLGGTPIVWEALRSAQIDLYPEFTGTLIYQILKDPTLVDAQRLRTRLAEEGIGMTDPLGYENNYALGIRQDLARRLGISRISDLRKHPELRFGFSTEFINRTDGWPGLQQTYELTAKNVRALEHGLAYQAIASGEIDLTDVYTTDAEIARFSLQVLEDDRHYFPRYAAVFLYRLDWAKQHPEALAALTRLSGRLHEEQLRTWNHSTQRGVPITHTAAEALSELFGLSRSVRVATVAERIVQHTLEHLMLVGISLTAAILVAIPLGILAWHRPRLGRSIIGITSLIQTIPSLALLVFLVTIPVEFGGGLGWRPAVVALFLYSLLPILRNTETGLADIPPHLREAAAGLGLTAWQRLRWVELPLAARSILGGIKTAAVINIGTATLGAFIGAGGLGVPIQEGLRIYDPRLILQGAIPAAILAIAVEFCFELAEKRLLPLGMPPSRESVS